MNSNPYESPQGNSPQNDPRMPPPQRPQQNYGWMIWLGGLLLFNALSWFFGWGFWLF